MAPSSGDHRRTPYPIFLGPHAVRLTNARHSSREKKHRDEKRRGIFMPVISSYYQRKINRTGITALVPCGTFPRLRPPGNLPQGLNFLYTDLDNRYGKDDPDFRLFLVFPDFQCRFRPGYPGAVPPGFGKAAKGFSRFFRSSMGQPVSVAHRGQGISSGTGQHPAAKQGLLHREPPKCFRHPPDSRSLRENTGFHRQERTVIRAFSEFLDACHSLCFYRAA